MTEERKLRLRGTLQASRRRLIREHGEFAEPLREMIFSAVPGLWHMSTNGTGVYFDPAWLQKLGDRELDFMLSHTLMHIKLEHIRRPQYYAGDRFHLACDIIVNSHLELLGWKYEKLPGVGRIFYETFYPARPGRELTPQEAMDGVPFDPAVMSPGMRRHYLVDSEDFWGRDDADGSLGEVVLRPGDPEPDGGDEEVGVGGGHVFFPKLAIKPKTGEDEDAEAQEKQNTGEDSAGTSAAWDKQVMQSLLSLREMQRRSNETGDTPEFRERLWQKPGDGRLNWRKLLRNFVQEEVFDYSFLPPDRRLQDSDLFLPDFQVKREFPQPVMFFADTSASVQDAMLNTVWRELCGAVRQFEGGLSGYLAFFDTRVQPPVPFSSVEELGRVIPHGGGGTDYGCVFDCAASCLESPSCIVIFTDGCADFPPESAARNVPVLWLFTREADAPPWGQWAVVKA